MRLRKLATTFACLIVFVTAPIAARAPGVVTLTLSPAVPDRTNTNSFARQESLIPHAAFNKIDTPRSGRLCCLSSDVRRAAY